MISCVDEVTLPLPATTGPPTGMAGEPCCWKSSNYSWSRPPPAEGEVAGTDRDGVHRVQVGSDRVSVGQHRFQAGRGGGNFPVLPSGLVSVTL